MCPYHSCGRTPCRSAVVALLAVEDVSLLGADAGGAGQDGCAGLQLAGGLAGALVLEDWHTGLTGALVADIAAIAGVLVSTALAAGSVWALAWIAGASGAVWLRGSQGADDGYGEHDQETQSETRRATMDEKKWRKAGSALSSRIIGECHEG